LRDLGGEGRDQLARLHDLQDEADDTTWAELRLRGERDRARAAADRAKAADDRARAASDRQQAARDRADSLARRTYRPLTSRPGVIAIKEETMRRRQKLDDDAEAAAELLHLREAE
jgi:hypothetical protein